jgi:hypothetical protein
MSDVSSTSFPSCTEAIKKGIFIRAALISKDNLLSLIDQKIVRTLPGVENATTIIRRYILLRLASYHKIT